MKLTSACLDLSSEGLATITLTQAARGNPFDGVFVKDMRDICLHLWETQGLRAVLIRAEGPNFSVGGDLKSFYPERTRLAPIVRSWTADLHMGLQRLWKLPVPIVAEVKGFAMGGGVALFAGCDVVLASRSAKIGSAFAQIGFSCDSGSTVALTARMGPARAKRFVMLAEMLTSQEALNAGLVDVIVEDEKLAEEAAALAKRLSQGPTLAYGEIKRLFSRAGSMHLEAMLEDEALTLARVSTSMDAQEGIASLVEKRQAVFKGC